MDAGVNSPRVAYRFLQKTPENENRMADRPSDLEVSFSPLAMRRAFIARDARRMCFGHLCTQCCPTLRPRCYAYNLAYLT